MRPSLVATIAILTAAGCGDDGAASSGHAEGGAAGSTAVVGGGGAGTAGSGGTACAAESVDILVDSRVLATPEDWFRSPTSFGKQNFWRFANEVGVVWLLPPEDLSAHYLLVSYFDAASGIHLDTFTYNPFPQELPPSGSAIIDSTGAPDGTFAVTLLYSDDTLAGGVAQIVVIGDRVGSQYAEWVPPWTRLEATLRHVAWDGEAFTIFSHNVGQGTLRVVRLSVDGTLLTGPIETGSVTTVQEGRIDFHTDPETGITWVASAMNNAVWLTGIHRDGSLIDGIDPILGGVAIEPNGTPASTAPAADVNVTANGDTALVSWWGVSHGMKQLVEVTAGVATSPTVAHFDEPGTKSVTHVTLPHGDGWWVGDHVNLEGLNTLSFDGDAITDTGLLVDHDPCEPNVTCLSPNQYPYFDAFHFQAEGRDDDRWLGYHDKSDCFDAPGHEPSCPFRILEIVDGCSYPTVHDLQNP